MLIGKNITLKTVRAEDFELISEWWSDPDYMGDFYNVWPQTPEGVKESMEEKNESGAYLILDREENKPMGTIGYFDPFAIRSFMGLEIWYQVHHDYRKGGVATQAACLLINHLFDSTTTQRIHATVAIGNDASCRVLEKAGMQKEGVYRSVFFLHGRYIDMHLYSIVRQDWKDENSYREGRPDF